MGEIFTSFLFYYKRNAMATNIQRQPKKYFKIKIYFFKRKVLT